MFLRHASNLFKMAIVLLVAAGIVSCAKKTYIDVDYRLPTPTDTLTGRSVFVETRDLRNDKEIFDDRAKKQFEYFTGLFALSLEQPDDQHKILGAYELPELFEKALIQRLQTLGVGIAESSSPTVPVFQIKINQFRIKLIGQKWLADVSYEASLAQDTRLIAREVVTGSAERMKLMGSGGAEKVIGEIFTDMINRLNIERLFQQAKL